MPGNVDAGDNGAWFFFYPVLFYSLADTPGTALVLCGAWLFLRQRSVRDWRLLLMLLPLGLQFHWHGEPVFVTAAAKRCAGKQLAAGAGR